MEEIKPVITEKYDSEYRDKSSSRKTLFNLWENRDFDAKDKLHEF